jgi:hypothetical protein
MSGQAISAGTGVDVHTCRCPKEILIRERGTVS